MDKDSQIYKLLYTNFFNGKHIEIHSGDLEFIVNNVNDLIKEKCLEQRKLCADHAEAKADFVGIESGEDLYDLYVDKNSILNAPEPTL